MLFLLKRSVPGGLAGLLVLAVAGFALRTWLPDVPRFEPSWRAAFLGLAIVSIMLASDALLHVLFCLLFRERYRRRHRDLVEVFRGQSLAAMLIGAVMAGIGEEPVFRGLGFKPAYLIVAAVAFGLLHHIRWSLWPFTVWAIYEGLLLAAGFYITQSLFALMVAHGLHDLAGFLLFRYLNLKNRLDEQPPPPPRSSSRSAERG